MNETDAGDDAKDEAAAEGPLKSFKTGAVSMCLKTDPEYEGFCGVF